MVSRPDEAKGGWGVVVVLCLALIFHNAMRLAPAPLMAELGTYLGVTYSGLGQIFGAHLLGNAVIYIPVGVLADRVDNKFLLAGGALLGCLCCVIFAYSRIYILSLAIRFIMGVASALLFIPSVRSIVALYPKEKRGAAMGFVEIGAGVGMLLALTVLPFLSGRFDLATTFMSLPVLGAVTLVCIIAILPNIKPQAKTKISGGLKLLARDRNFWCINGFAFFNMMATYAVLAWLPTFFREEFAYTAVQAGLVTSLVNLTLAGFSPAAGIISDKLGRRTPVLATGSVLAILCCLVLMFSHSQILVLVAVVFIGVSMAFTIPLVLILVGERFGGAGSGLAMSITGTSGRLAASLSGVVFGYVLQWGGSFVFVWGLVLAFSLIRLPLVIGVRENRTEQG